MNTLIWLAAQGPGKKLEESLGNEIGAIFMLIVIFVSVTLFWKRAFTAFLGFVLFAMLVSVFVFRPDFVTQLGENGFQWLFEAYLK
ncbi:hypothetical protein [Shimazuella alba]|jgi:hypothetical protein|uniref:Uncharacterized protein n=1 Tax=Shimazuella alba TaxID=2690964 RepID=A0A6I4W000_9BACL|nr:hypothetical protein [Shimazuella alba]MXQ55525.1 hypothetical protein [Shimazuella alba]